MKFKTFKLTSPQGISRYEEMTDLEGLCRIAISMYAAGERSPRLMAIVEWIASLGRFPTVEEFHAFMKSHGVDIVPSGETMSEIEN